MNEVSPLREERRNERKKGGGKTENPMRSMFSVLVLYGSNYSLGHNKHTLFMFGAIRVSLRTDPDRTIDTLVAV